MISLYITLLFIDLDHSSNKQSKSNTGETGGERVISQIKLAKETRCASIAEIENYKVKESNRDVLLCHHWLLHLSVQLPNAALSVF